MPGRYVTDQDGVEYIACTIPSIQFLIVESIDLGVPLPESKEFVIEVSMNEETFSDDEFKFKYIENNQLLNTDIQVGPDTGGTVIQTNIVDFPTVNDVASVARCVFPGYEDLADENGEHPGMIEATLLQN